MVSWTCSKNLERRSSGKKNVPFNQWDSFLRITVVENTENEDDRAKF